MAISKKQQAEFDAKLEAALTQAALRWTGDVVPDVKPPNPMKDRTETLVKGFLPTGGLQAPYAEEACSSSIHHSSGRSDKANSQGACALFSTRALALRHARHRCEKEFAASLRRLDKMIEAEESKT